jgi:type I restriction-modification system DNA methylase subunit
MTAAELQQRFQKQYVTAGWLNTLRQILPRTEIFAKPQKVIIENARAESILQLGKIPLADSHNLALLEVVVDENTDLPGNRAALRHLVAKYIDLAEYHGVFAIFHQPKVKDYRFTFAARETALDDSGQLVRTETAPRRYTYLLGPNESCRTAAERFDLLARKGEAATIADVRAAFDKEPLTREFFKRFEDAIEAVKTDLEKHQALPSAQAYSRAQLLLERLLFLYFVQNRGWLDQKRNFLLDNFPSHRVSPDEFTYYSDFLERVFFTLSTPSDFKGPGAGVRLPGLPFLNGGLFDDDEFAQTHERKKDNPPLRVRNGTFAGVFENLLEAFNFTAHEDTPIDQDVAVDPEMLGKVFESIVLHAEAADPDAIAPDKRKATGSYYTPRIVVHFICRESLCQYLLPRLPDGKEWNRRLRALLDILALDGLDTDELALLKTLLTPAEGRQILDLIRDLKCLDPSVGSGAFPVGLLHELVNLRRICDAAALGYVDPVRKHGNQWVHQQKAEIVENCLYGVDLQQQAIEICRLRLWLSLVVDYDLGCDPFNAAEKSFRTAIRDISQLPNLEMNFRRGDSLLDMVSNVPIRVTSDLLTGRSDDVAAIQKLGHELHKAKNAQKKKKLRLEILGLRLDLSERVLADEKKSLLNQAQNVTGNWFGESVSDNEQQRKIEAELKNVEAAFAKLAADRKELERIIAAPLAADFYQRLRKLEGADFDSPFNFVWRIDYAEIFTAKKSGTTIAGNLNLGDELAAKSRTGGFDLIVGNPPFVTARNPVKRELYRERWKRVCHMKFQLVCPFFDLSFGLLRSGGQLGFIVSNAFAKREFGQPLIEDFFPTVDLQKVVDCSGLMFPGHGTPTCILFGAQRKPDDKKPIRVAALVPGGGDLRTPPEDSHVWHTLAAQHDKGFDHFSTVRVSPKRAKSPGVGLTA